MYLVWIPACPYRNVGKNKTEPHHQCLRARNTSRRTNQPHADPTPSNASQPRSDDALALPRLHTWPSDLAPTSLVVCTRQGQRCSYLASLAIHHPHPCVLRRRSSQASKPAHCTTARTPSSTGERELQSRGHTRGGPTTPCNRYPKRLIVLAVFGTFLVVCSTYRKTNYKSQGVVLYSILYCHVDCSSCISSCISFFGEEYAFAV
ncbi:hypothetical protein FIBSPDRAFT_182517 [Athelia psychrophila]|uniref:Uncharacterized protein n=1 Tax=Athelia psychrophila TaxID=1759441 RepID=A0A166AH15_9AGAM|nr:hypothetical protein FIBSPDRAFT_182517 [Fibularhizoctonia sp. CBS 109695]